MKRDIVLSGRSVALAVMTESDQPKFCLWLQSDELRGLIDDPREPGIEDQMKWFKRVQKRDRKFFSLVTVPDNTLIGNCGFVDIYDDKQEATLRITIGNPDYLGKGFGTEAVKLLLEYGFERAGWKEIRLNVLASNTRAIRTYEKCGFTSVAEEKKDDKTLLTMHVLKPVRV
jgi:RimJ/RimL family protein N-acetyltransferase